jgi:hypothetical protein
LNKAPDRVTGRGFLFAPRSGVWYPDGVDSPLGEHAVIRSLSRRLVGSFAALVAAASLLGAEPSPGLKPHLVTFKLDATLDKALDELQTQADVAFDRSKADLTRPVKISFEKIPFWEALEKVAKAADHRVAFGEQGRTIYLLGGEGIAYRELPLSVDGVFRTAARQVVAVNDIEADRTYTDVELQINWEPHFSAFLIDSPGKSVTAVDNNGKQLEVADQGRGRIAAAGGGRRLTVRLADVPRSARTITKLEGTLNVVGAERMLRFEFPRPVAGKEESKTDDQVTAKVEPGEDVKAGSDLWTFRVTFAYPEGGPQLESFESGAWMAENDAFLLSADGKRRLDCNGGYEVVTQSERGATVKYRWVPQGDEKDLGKPADWKVVVRTPSRLVEVPVKFKLEHIPLP